MNNHEKEEFPLPNSGFDKAREDISKQREKHAELKEKIVYTVEASGDGGETWDIIGEYGNEAEAVKYRRKVAHGPSGDFDYRVGVKE